MKILANDGISESGKNKLEEYGFKVDLTKVSQEQLVDYINTNSITSLLVRSATQVRKDIIDNCPSLKIIGRGGVGMDNIDVEYAKSKGLQVINTPAASSKSVAELVFSHLFSCVRFLHESNRSMPLDGDSKFKDLKKAYALGSELRGKKIGIVGFGRIGQEVARIALGLGMEVVATDHLTESAPISIEFFNGQKITITIETTDLDTLLKESDFISLHVPVQEEYVISTKEISKMKTGVGIINAARGGVIDELALIKAIEKNKVKFAGLDVYEKEPNPEIQLLMNPELSLTPHIGAATIEAQDRIGTELASQIIKLLKE